MFARVHTVETTAEGHDRGLELVREILPWLRDCRGFRGVLRLATKDRSKTVMISLWADEAALIASAAASRDLGHLITEASGTERLAMEDYEVTFFEGEIIGPFLT
jgi:heme-degrading monooxygenase HmoA